MDVPGERGRGVGLGDRDGRISCAVPSRDQGSKTASRLGARILPSRPNEHVRRHYCRDGPADGAHYIPQRMIRHVAVAVILPAASAAPMALRPGFLRGIVYSPAL